MAGDSVSLPLQPTEYCETRNRPLMRAVSKVHGAVLLFRPRCKQWSCPYCSVENAKYWGVIASHGTGQLMGRNKTVLFVTLTAHEKLENQAQTLYVWKKAWPKLMQRARRKAKGSMEYLAIPEPHKDGRVHVHMLTTYPLDLAWWKDNARSCGLGYQADVQPVNDAGHAAWYTTKYMGKQLALNAWPPNFRRVRASQSWPRPPERDLPNWEFYSGLESEKDQFELTQELRHSKEEPMVVINTNHKTAWRMIEFLDENA